MIRRVLCVAAAAWLAACAGPAVRPAPPPGQAPGAGVQPARRVFVPEPAPVAQPPAEPARPETPSRPAPPPPEKTRPEPLPPPDPLAEARHRFDAGDFRGAWTVLRDAPESVEAARFRGDVLVALGRYADAARAYGKALALGAADPAELETRIRALVDALDPEGLRQVAQACPFCPEGGYARLRLAQQAAAEGRTVYARDVLAALEADFAGHPVGDEAARLRRRLEAEGAAKPGTYGVLLPLSGPLAPFGRRALRGVLLGSGLFGPHDPGVRLLVADSRGEPEAAARAVEDLATRGAVGIVGPLKGAAARAAAEKARELGVPLLTLTPAAGVAGDGVFRLHLPREDEMAALVAYAVRVLGYRRFAVLYPDTEAGLLYRDLFWDRVVAEGGEITGVESFSGTLDDAGTAIEKLTGVYGLSPEEIRERFIEEERLRLRRERELLAALGVEPAFADEPVEVDEERLARYRPRPIVDFDALFLPVPSRLAGQVAPLLPYHDVEAVTLLGVRTWNFPTLVEVGEEYVEGAVFAAEFHPETPQAREFVRAYRQAFGEDPGVLEAYARDAAALLVAGGSGESRPELRARLSGLRDAPGVTGPLTARPDGDIAGRPVILTVRKGRIVPAPYPTGANP